MNASASPWRLNGAALVRRGPTTLAQQFCVACSDEGFCNANLSVIFRVIGRFERAVVDDVVATLVNRHEALRTTLHRGETGLEQWLWDEVSYPIEDVDLRSRPEALQAELAAYVDSDVQILEEVLLHVRVFTLSSSDHVIALRISHAISDGWSCRILDAEFRALYLAGAEGKMARLAPVGATWHAFAAREAATHDDAKRAYWKNVLGVPRESRGLQQPVEQPSVVRRPWLPCELPPLSDATVELLTQVARTARVPSAIAATASVASLFVARGADTIRIGVVHSNRFSADVQALVGAVADFLPVQIDLTGSPSFEQLLVRTQAAWLAALANRLPYEQICQVAGFDALTGDLMCDVTFNYLSPTATFPAPTEAANDLAKIETLRLPWRSIRPLISRGCSLAPWTVTLAEDKPSLHGMITVQLGTVSIDALTELAATIADAISRAVRRPDQPLAAVLSP